MKFLLSIILTLILSSCNSNGESKFTEIECTNEEMPEFDGRKVSLLDENGVAYKDTIIEKIQKRRTVFKPCRDFIYRAKFYNCLLYTSPSPRDRTRSRMPSSA